MSKSTANSSQTHKKPLQIQNTPIANPNQIQSKSKANPQQIHSNSITSPSQIHQKSQQIQSNSKADPQQIHRTSKANPEQIHSLDQPRVAQISPCYLQDCIGKSMFQDCIEKSALSDCIETFPNRFFRVRAQVSLQIWERILCHFCSIWKPLAVHFGALARTFLPAPLPPNRRPTTTHGFLKVGLRITCVLRQSISDFSAPPSEFWCFFGPRQEGDGARRLIIDSELLPYRRV